MASTMVLLINAVISDTVAAAAAAAVTSTACVITFTAFSC